MDHGLPHYHRVFLFPFRWPQSASSGWCCDASAAFKLATCYTRGAPKKAAEAHADAVVFPMLGDAVRILWCLFMSKGALHRTSRCVWRAHAGPRLDGKLLTPSWGPHWVLELAMALGWATLAPLGCQLHFSQVQDR